MIGMEQVGLKPDYAIRERLAATLPAIRRGEPGVIEEGGGA